MIGSFLTLFLIHSATPQYQYGERSMKYQMIIEDDRPKTDTKNEWLNSKEAAEYLRLVRADGTPDPFRIRTLVHQGRLPFYKPFGRLIFLKSELKSIVEKSRQGGWKLR